MIHWPSFFFGVCAGFVGAFILSGIVGAVLMWAGDDEVITAPDKIEPLNRAEVDAL